MRPKTVSAPRFPGLNFIRVVLATLVLVDHCFPLSGSHERLEYRGLGLGTWCVAGFFCISGYLIAGSRVRMKAHVYLWHRVLRIFPGLVVAVFLTAFVFAPIATLTRGAGPWNLADAVRYVVRNVLLYQPPFQIGGTLRDAPFPDAWNGSLWTLFHEFSAYLVIGAILSLQIVRRHAAPTLGCLLVLTTIAGPTLHHHMATSLYQHALFLGTYFLAGSFLWSVRERLPLTAPGAAVAGLLLVATAATQPLPCTWSALPLAYVLLWLGHASPVRLFSTNDISYGIYIYAFPLQQLIVVLFGVHNPYVLLVSALCATSGVAFLSWSLVERPALRLKNLLT